MKEVRWKNWLNHWSIVRSDESYASEKLVAFNDVWSRSCRPENRKASVASFVYLAERFQVHGGERQDGIDNLTEIDYSAVAWSLSLEKGLKLAANLGGEVPPWNCLNYTPPTETAIARMFHTVISYRNFCSSLVFNSRPVTFTQLSAVSFEIRLFAMKILNFIVCLLFITFFILIQVVIMFVYNVYNLQFKKYLLINFL